MASQIKAGLPERAELPQSATANKSQEEGKLTPLRPLPAVLMSTAIPLDTRPSALLPPGLSPT